jgi:predicted phage baseplate assembly protein
VPVLAPAAGDPAPPPEGDAKVFTVDRESGEIRFGDGAHGMRPPRNATRIASYDHGGGLAGMVGIDAIKKAPGLDSGIQVTNPVPTWGGDEAETVEEAERNIPAMLRTRERLVSVADTLEIAWRTPGVDLGRVEVLPTLHPELPTQVSDGVVTVLTVPERDPLHPDAPRPDRLFLETVCRWLEPRRVLTTELHVVGPTYRRIWVSVGVDVIPGHDAPAIREAVAAEIRRFLSPLGGGFETTGWPLGRAVEALVLLATASRVAGVAKVNTLRLGEASGGEVDRVELAPLELPELVNAVVEPGDAPTLDEVLGLVEEEAVEDSVVPVPVVPESC